jgi:hypothetical protein
MFVVETWPQCLLWTQTLWLGLHIKHCGYVSTSNIVAMSPHQTLWLCLHNKHCGYVSTTNIVAMSPQQTLAVSFIGGGNRVPIENHQPVAGHRQTLSHNVVLSTPRLGVENLL